MKLVNQAYDKATGITEQFFFQEGIDGKPGRVTMRRLQDVEGTLDLNKAQFNEHSGIGYSDSVGGAHHVARIPFIVIEQWLQEGFNWYQSTDKERRERLNRPENRYLLVRPGRL